MRGRWLHRSLLGHTPICGGSRHHSVESFLFQTPQSQEHLSELEKAIDVIIDVFHQYSRREGDRDTLTKGELKLLIEKQLASYLKVSEVGAGFLAAHVGRLLNRCPGPEYLQGLVSPPSHPALLHQHLLPGPSLNELRKDQPRKRFL